VHPGQLRHARQVVLDLVEGRWAGIAGDVVRPAFDQLSVIESPRKTTRDSPGLGAASAAFASA
jgi:hypothetical protein